MRAQRAVDRRERLDNLVKGAAGQAIQCANLMYGIQRRRGCLKKELSLMAEGATRACSELAEASQVARHG